MKVKCNACGKDVDIKDIVLFFRDTEEIKTGPCPNCNHVLQFVEIKNKENHYGERTN